MREIRVWQDTGERGEPVWHASYPGGECSTGGFDAQDWVLQHAVRETANQGIRPEEYVIVYGHYERMWVPHA